MLRKRQGWFRYTNKKEQKFVQVARYSAITNNILPKWAILQYFNLRPKEIAANW